VFYTTYVLLWLLVLFQGVLLLLIFRHFGHQALGTLAAVQRDGLRVGAKAPDVEGVQPSGEAVSWRPPGNRTALMLFAAPDCAPCHRVLPYVAGAARDAPELEVVTVVPGSREDAAKLVELVASPLSTIASDGAFEAFRVEVTPFAFVLGQDGRVLAKGLCDSPERLWRMLDSGGVSTAVLQRAERLPMIDVAVEP
jgi:methylamine dehydrogenase accessory protein MauD